MNSSKEYYDKLAAHYQDISRKRLNFLDAIDQYVIDRAGNVSNYLDIGAGDGSRSMNIANAISPEHITLIEPSPEIASGIIPNDKLEVIISDISDFRSGMKYELITCLWNVLGHVGDLEERRIFFQCCKELLAPNGRLILDVNNRYNVSVYGNKDVMENLTNDLEQKPGAGYFDLGDSESVTQVYIHAPLEIENLALDVGLHVSELRYIDYETGKFRDTFFEGQLFYVIEHE